MAQQVTGGVLRARGADVRANAEERRRCLLPRPLVQRQALHQLETPALQQLGAHGEEPRALRTPLFCSDGFPPEPKDQQLLG